MLEEELDFDMEVIMATTVRLPISMYEVGMASSDIPLMIEPVFDGEKIVDVGEQQ